MPPPFTPLGDRVVIQADIEDRAPTETESGLLLAKSLAAAIDGFDAEESWFVGTVVAVGPLVNHFDVRPWVRKKVDDIIELCTTYTPRTYHAVLNMRDELLHLPAECPDPLRVGDRVTFSWQAGQQITVDGVKYLILRQSDVLAVVDPEESEAA